MIEVAGEANLIEGFKTAGEALTINHLQFENDTIIFCASDIDQ